MLFSILTVFIIHMAALGSPTGHRESTDVQWPRVPFLNANANAKRPAAKSVVECAIKHLQNFQLGSYVPTVTMALGSPPQEFSAILDSGSGDLVVGRTDSAFCKFKGAQCAEPQQGGRGSFNLNKSVNTSFVSTFTNLQYFRDDSYAGEFRRTVATVGAVQVPELQFALADNVTGIPANPLVPLVGIGPILGETPSVAKYPNLPARMREVGVIKSNVYGVYLNDFRGPDGSIVFGGVDAAKFTGELKEAALVPNALQPGENPEDLGSFSVEFSSLQLVDLAGGQNRNLTNQDGNASTSIGITNLAPPQGLPIAFLDTGNPSVNLPQDAIATLAKELGGELAGDVNFVSRFKCEVVQGKALRFGFNRDNAIIDVPLQMFIVPSDIAKDADPNLPPGMCDTVIASSTSIDVPKEIASLGAPVFQAVYVVFDAERSRLMFAPAVFNTTRSDLRELGPDWTGTVSGTGGKDGSSGAPGSPGSPGCPGGAHGLGDPTVSTVNSASDTAPISSSIAMALTVSPGQAAVFGLIAAAFCL